MNAHSGRVATMGIHLISALAFEFTLPIIIQDASAVGAGLQLIAAADAL